MLLITQVAWSGVELSLISNVSNNGAYPNGSELNSEKLMDEGSGLDYGRLRLNVLRCSYHHDTLLNSLKYGGYKANIFYLILLYKIFLLFSQIFLRITYDS
jgi:hypothetical protein